MIKNKKQDIYGEVDKPRAQLEYSILNYGTMGEYSILWKVSQGIESKVVCELFHKLRWIE